jgi:dolichol-phosphate mannosyltransferase
MKKHIKNKLSIIIPTYNEAENIVNLLNEILVELHNFNFEIIVVDDGSEDLTAEIIIKNFQENDKIKLIRRRLDKGLLQSIKLGLQTISGTAFLVMDGDGQHDPKDIPGIIDLLENNDLVIGVRDLSKTQIISRMRINLSRFFNFLTNLVLQQKISDPLTGFFAGKINLLNQKFFSINNSGFKILLDLIYANKNGLNNISEKIINFRARRKGVSKLKAHVFFSFSTQLISYLFGGLISSKFIGFAIIGGFGFVLHFLMMFYLFKTTALTFILIHSISTLVAATANYTLNNYLNFYENNFKNNKNFLFGLLKYYLINIPSILASLGGASFAYNILTSSPYIASLTGIIFDTIFKYALSINWIWKSK